MSGLNAEEARSLAGLPIRSNYWKRCSELRQMGLIQATGEERPGDTDMDQMVSEITPRGVGVVRDLLSQGWAMFPPLPPSARNSDPETSHAAAESEPRKTRAQSQVSRLLISYYCAKEPT